MLLALFFVSCVGGGCGGWGYRARPAAQFNRNWNSWVYHYCRKQEGLHYCPILNISSQSGSRSLQERGPALHQYCSYPACRFSNIEPSGPLLQASSEPGFCRKCFMYVGGIDAAACVVVCLPSSRVCVVFFWVLRPAKGEFLRAWRLGGLH